jgi:hypothetical protein
MSIRFNSFPSFSQSTKKGQLKNTYTRILIMLQNNENENILSICIFRFLLWILIKKTSSFLEVYMCFERFGPYSLPSFLPDFPSALAFSILAF